MDAAYSTEVIAAIKSVLKLDSSFEFMEQPEQVQRSLMNAYLEKLTPVVRQGGITAVAEGQANGSEGNFCIILFIIIALSRLKVSFHSDRSRYLAFIFFLYC